MYIAAHFSHPCDAVNTLCEWAGDSTKSVMSAREMKFPQWHQIKKREFEPLLRCRRQTLEVLEFNNCQRRRMSCVAHHQPELLCLCLLAQREKLEELKSSRKWSKKKMKDDKSELISLQLLRVGRENCQENCHSLSLLNPFVLCRTIFLRFPCPLSHFKAVLENFLFPDGFEPSPSRPKWNSSFFSLFTLHSNKKTHRRSGKHENNSSKNEEKKTFSDKLELSRNNKEPKRESGNPFSSPLLALYARLSAHFRPLETL